MAQGRQPLGPEPWALSLPASVDHQRHDGRHGQQHAALCAALGVQMPFLPVWFVAKGLDARQSAAVARQTFEILTSLPDLSHQTAEPPMREFVERSGLSASQVFGILRVAVTGQKVSPPLFESMEIIGKEKVIERLQMAIAILDSM